MFESNSSGLTNGFGFTIATDVVDEEDTFGFVGTEEEFGSVEAMDECFKAWGFDTMKKTERDSQNI